MQNRYFHPSIIKDISIKESGDFNGYQIFFTIKDQRFQFLVGNSTAFFPLAVKHFFQSHEQCNLCQDTIPAVPVGQLPCTYLQTRQEALLEFLQSDLQKYMKR